MALTRTSALLNRVALPAMSLGMVFQFVFFAEADTPSGQLTLASVHNSESLLALMIMAAFMIVYLVYRTTSPGIVVFPLVFVLTSSPRPPNNLSAPRRLRCAGLALCSHCHDLYRVRALFLSFAASLLYLLQERRSEVQKAIWDFVASAGAGSHR